MIIPDIMQETETETDRQTERETDTQKETDVTLCLLQSFHEFVGSVSHFLREIREIYPCVLISKLHPCVTLHFLLA